MAVDVVTPEHSSPLLSPPARPAITGHERWKHRIGLSIVAGTVFLAAFGPILAPWDPTASSGSQVLVGPSAEHWLGTDITGKDVFSRVISAPRWDVTIAFASTGLSLLIGVSFGVLAGYFGHEPGVKRGASELILRITDIIQSFPPIILALGLIAATGAGVLSVVLVVAFVSAPIFLRLTRSMALAVNERTFVRAARVGGASDMAIILRHILPHSLGPALAQASVVAGWSILLTAGLSFVGAGVPVPTPEWGSMIAIGQDTIMTGQWWPALFPGLALGLTVGGYALAGEAIREWFVERGRE